MIKNFTIHYLLKKMVPIDGTTPKSRFIKEALSNSFEPSPVAVSNILAFSNAYRAQKTESIGNVEFIIN